MVVEKPKVDIAWPSSTKLDRNAGLPQALKVTSSHVAERTEHALAPFDYGVEAAKAPDSSGNELLQR